MEASFKHYHEESVRNEHFVKECLRKIHAAHDPQDGLRSLLKFLGESLDCDRVYVFEVIDRQHIQNTYEWCKEGVRSGIEQLPYIAKKDLLPWYAQLMNGENIIETNVKKLQEENQLIYDFLKPQDIHSIILSPLLSQGVMTGLLGSDNPPPDRMGHISVVFDVLAYFVNALLNQRELQKLRKSQELLPKPSSTFQLKNVNKTILLVDDSPELLKCNEKVLRSQGYRIHSASTIQSAREVLSEIRPDAIVLDIDLPDGNGIDFCHEINGDIPVVFLTAWSDEQAIHRGMQVGCSAFLTKPYQLKELQAAVADAINHNRKNKN